DAIDLSGDARDGRVVWQLTKSAGRAARAFPRVDQPVRMALLQITLHAFWAEHPAIEREVVPRLDPDDRVVLDLQLHAALLPAETAMRFHERVRLDAGIEPD